MPVPVAVRSAAAHFTGIVGSKPAEVMDVCLCECCVLSGRGLCDELISRPEESCRLRCVVLCDLETSCCRRPWSELDHSDKRKKNVKCVW